MPFYLIMSKMWYCTSSKIYTNTDEVLKYLLFENPATFFTLDIIVLKSKTQKHISLNRVIENNILEQKCEYGQETVIYLATVVSLLWLNLKHPNYILFKKFTILISRFYRETILRHHCCFQFKCICVFEEIQKFLTNIVCSFNRDQSACIVKIPINGGVF